MSNASSARRLTDRFHLPAENPPPCNFHYLSASCQQGVCGRDSCFTSPTKAAWLILILFLSLCYPPPLFPRQVACPYAHDYDLSPDMIAQLRADARKTPCPTVYKVFILTSFWLASTHHLTLLFCAVLKGKKCRDTNCHRGHSCPNVSDSFFSRR